MPATNLLGRMFATWSHVLNSSTCKVKWPGLNLTPLWARARWLHEYVEIHMLLKDGIFQLLLWRLRDMNNFEFWRQFSAFVELIFGREGCVMILQYFCLKFFYLLLTKQNKTAGEISPTLGLWKRAPKFKIVHITKSA